MDTPPPMPLVVRAVWGLELGGRTQLGSPFWVGETQIMELSALSSVAL